MGRPGQTPDLFPQQRPAMPDGEAVPAPEPVLGNRRAPASGIPGTHTFATEDEFERYIAANGLALLQAEARSLLEKSSADISRWLNRVEIKRGQAARHRLEVALQLERQKQQRENA